MVYSWVLTVFVLCFILQINADDVVYRGTAGDGTYNEVRHSNAAIPGGEAKTITTYSSRVLGGNSPILGANLNAGLGVIPQNRMIGLDNFGFGSQSIPTPSFSPLIPQNYIDSIRGPSSPANALNPALFSLLPGNLNGLQRLPQLQQPYPYVPFANQYFSSPSQNQILPLGINSPAQGLTGLNGIL